MNNEAYQKAVTINNLLNKLTGVRIFDDRVYWSDGTLDFTFRSKTVLECRVVPLGDNNYSVKIFKSLNLCETTILKEFISIKASEFCDTLSNTIKFLDSEYSRLNLRSWSEYERGKLVRGKI